MKRMVANICVPNCNNALKYYQEIFGGAIDHVVPQSDGSRIITHAELKINHDISLFLRCAHGAIPQSQTVTFTLEAETQEELTAMYDKLRREGTVIAPPEKTLRGKQNCLVTDKYGVTWGLTYVTP